MADSAAPRGRPRSKSVTDATTPDILLKFRQSSTEPNYQEPLNPLDFFPINDPRVLERKLSTNQRRVDSLLFADLS